MKLAEKTRKQLRVVPPAKPRPELQVQVVRSVEQLDAAWTARYVELLAKAPKAKATKVRQPPFLRSVTPAVTLVA